MPVDPRLNCAAEICCPPPQAREAKLSIIDDLLVDTPGLSIQINGKPYKVSEMLADRMTALDIEFAPVSLMRAIRDLADHPNRKEKEK